MKNIRYVYKKILGVLVVIMLTTNARGFDYIPDSKSDWIKWPEYCRARSQMIIDHHDRYSKEWKEWDRKIGKTTFLHIHHYCMGLTKLGYAEKEGNSKKRKRLYEIAKSQIYYTLSKISIKEPLYITMALNYAEACYGLGDTKEAIRTIKGLIRDFPDNIQAYLGTAGFFQNRKQYGDAVKILSLGRKRVRKRYVPMLLYKIGFNYYKMEDFENARKYARLAAGKGYKGLGLKRKLESAGYPY